MSDLTDFERLKRAVARVDWAGTGGASEPLGTAFHVGDGYLLTACHVVATPPAVIGGEFRLDFTETLRECTARVVDHDPRNDWAILKWDEPPGAYDGKQPRGEITALDCSLTVEKDARWETFGYALGLRNGDADKGVIDDPDARDPHDKDGSLRALALSSGKGDASLKGFSGGPCMVGPRVVGIMRTALTGSRMDGAGRSVLITVGGRAWACPAKAVVARAPRDGRQVPLPGHWTAAPAAAPAAAASNFLVVLPDDPARSDRLPKVVAAAYRSLMSVRAPLQPPPLDPPTYLDAQAALASSEALLETVRHLCRAQVVVFNVTGFSPAVVLLVGIRAVVRRGVTILSIGGDFVLGDTVTIPFNLQDANIVSHASRQETVPDEDMRPVALLARRIRRGLKAFDTPSHVDLPVFEAVRRLPAERRGIRPPESGVLVLCSFDRDYLRLNWARLLKPAFADQLKLLRGEQVPPPDGEDGLLGVARSFELNSPQLVSRAIYETMRRAQCCVVDLTGWQPAVLFELGVRLAVSPNPTACMVTRAEAAGASPDQERLLALLVDPRLHYAPPVAGVDGADDECPDYLDEPAFALAYGPEALGPASGPCSGAVHHCIAACLDIAQEPSARPVYRDLLDAADLFAPRRTRGQDAKPASLFPGRTELLAGEAAAEFERLLAVALYIVHRHGEAALPAAGDMREALDKALDGLFADRHQGRMNELPAELQALLKRC